MRSCSRMNFLKITSDTVEYALCTRCRPNFLPIEDKVRDADLFEQGTKVVALGNL